MYDFHCMREEVPFKRAEFHSMSKPEQPKNMAGQEHRSKFPWALFAFYYIMGSNYTLGHKTPDYIF